MPSAPIKTAIVTGACSGIGLALVEHLLSLQKPKWRIVLADLNPPPSSISHLLDQSHTLYIRTDVSSWSDNATLFKTAFDWPGEGSGRIDFFAANAGTGDKESVSQHFDLDADPEPPNLKCIDVNLYSVLYALKLFIHYARKTKRNLSASANGHTDSPPFNPKMTITASCVGQYPFAVAPHYAATKHAIVGLTRSVADRLLREDNIAVNCVMPAFVATNLAPPGLVDAWPKEYVTPMSTMMRAFDELGDERGTVEMDGLSDGEDGIVKAGQAVEVVLERLFYRKHVDFPDESQRWMISQTDEGGLWVKGYGGGAGIKKEMGQKQPGS